MRLTLPAAALLLVVLHTCLPGVTSAAAMPSKPAATLATSHPKPHLRFKERNGGMGFVYGALLGPIGYCGVRIFSRNNEAMRYNAAQGFKVWGKVVASCVILMGLAALKATGDQGSGLLNAVWTF